MWTSVFQGNPLQPQILGVKILWREGLIRSSQADEGRVFDSVAALEKHMRDVRAHEWRPPGYLKFSLLVLYADMSTFKFRYDLDDKPVDVEGYLRKIQAHRSRQALK